MKIYNVMQYGAKGDGKTNDAFPFSTLLTIVQNQAAAGLFFQADMFFTAIQSGLKRMLTSISKRALQLRLQVILTDISGQTSLSMTLKRRL